MLVPKLKEGEPNPGVVLSVLYAIGDLAEVTVGDSELQVWMQELMVRICPVFIYLIIIFVECLTDPILLAINNRD